MRRPISFLLLSTMLACKQPVQKELTEDSPQSQITSPVEGVKEFARIGRFDLKEWEFFYSIEIALEMLTRQGASKQDIEKYMDEIREKSKEATIEGFIISSLLAREAERRGEKVSPEEIKAERQKQFKERKPPAKTPEADLEAVIERNILSNRMIKLFNAEVTLTDAEAEKFYRDALTRIVVEYVTVSSSVAPTEAELKAFAAANQEKIKAYYEANKREFVLPEAIQVKHILLKTPSDEARKKAKDLEAAGKFPEAAQAIKDDEARAKGNIEAIAREIEAGLKFDEAAQKYSEDASSKAQGGALDWLARGQMLKPFEDAAFAMQPGQISKPVKTGKGYHLIVLQEKRAEQQQDLAAVEMVIAAQLFAEEGVAAKASAQRLLDELKAGKTLAEVAAANSLTVQKTEPFSAVQKALPGFGSDATLVAAIQGLTKEKSLPDAPLKMGQSFVVPVLLSREEPDMTPFQPNKEQIKGSILEMRQKEKLDEWLKAAKEKEGNLFEVNYTLLPNWKI
jgi:parvulin-like peptidyl-prolyl isomerase